MSDSIKPSKASFPCKFCQKSIHVPAGLSAITAPCPYCGKEVTSPDFSELEKLDSKPTAIDKNDDVESSVPIQGAAHKKPVILGGDGTTIKKTSDLAHAETKSNEVGVASGNEARFVWIVLIVLLSVIIGLAAWLAYQDEGAVVEGGLQAEAEGSVTAEELRQEWVTHGWKKEASEVLAGFMAAKSIDERMMYAIANDGVLDDLREFYPPGSDDRDTPIEFFAHRSGAMQDHERGIFRMQYRQPGQVELSEYFAPIGTLDKIMEIKGATLIDMAYAIDKSNVSAPIAVVAFFKGTEEGLKLDASIFIQGKFRTFRSFVDYPQLGHKKIFRVAISESIDHELRDDQQYRSYRIQDFAYPEEHVNVAVKADSKIGRALADINWRGMNREYQSRNATIELGWSKDKPARLQIERFICWEFLGVGGVDGKASEQAGELTKDPQKSSE